MIVNIFEYAANNYSAQLVNIMLGNTDALCWNTVFDSIVSQLLPNGGTIYFPSFFSNPQGGSDYNIPYLLRRPLVINATNTPINIVGDDVGSHSVLKFVKNSDYGIQVTGAGNISIKRISIHGDGKILNDGIFVAGNTKISIYDTEVHHCKKKRRTNRFSYSRLVHEYCIRLSKYRYWLFDSRYTGGRYCLKCFQ